MLRVYRSSYMGSFFKIMKSTRVFFTPQTPLPARTKVNAPFMNMAWLIRIFWMGFYLKKYLYIRPIHYDRI